MESARQVEARIWYRDAEALLRKAFPKGSTAWTLHVDNNQSGVYHSIVILALMDGEIVNVSVNVSRLMENPYDNQRHAVRMQGGGLDLGHHAVDWLSRTLHGDSNHIHHARL